MYSDYPDYREKRWRRAVAATRSLHGWVRYTLVTVMTALAGGMALWLAAETDAAVEQVIAGAAGVGAISLLIPLVEFVWHYSRMPFRDLREDVLLLRLEVSELAQMVRPEPAQLRAAVKELRDEARDNMRSLEGVAARGRYWKLTEDAPRTKAWRKHREVIRGVAELETVWEAGRQAAAETDRILQARALRMFSRDRRVRDDDRLADAVAAVGRFADELETASFLV